uniref:Nucleoporin n=1 Tax=Trypanosoma congolense (strain IL3000) TaxID=1068625 RepID=G0UZ27_TRYCI|nr:conserved hypothetical protein [Trypanosoma congolense IL3000]
MSPFPLVLVAPKHTYTQAYTACHCGLYKLPAMFSGSKRSREDDVEGEGERDECVPAAFHQMSAELEEIVKSVGSVNGAVLQSVIRRAQQLEQALAASNGSAIRQWKQISQCQQSRMSSALAHICTVQEVHQKELTINVMKEQFESGTSVAVEQLTNSFEAANKATVALFSSQLEGEKELNERLVVLVRDFLQKSLANLNIYSRRAINAELSLLKKELSVARLQSSLNFYQNAHLRHDEEILALINVVRVLAAKGREADRANSQLRQARTHVRLLEKELDLAGIIHAIIPPDFVPQQPLTEPPSDALRRTAPEYFAFRLLQHRDVTLSELVDSWQLQEARIAEAESKCEELQEQVNAARREVMTVHKYFVEEKRRREVVEHRLADLVRERIHPSGSDLPSRQLTQVRINYTKTLDDLAQTTTSLNFAREELAAQKERCAELEDVVRQLKEDSDTDGIVRTVVDLRRYYEEEVARLRNDAVNSATQTSIALAHAEMQQQASTKIKDALKSAEQAFADVSAVLSRAESKKFEGKGDTGVVRAGQLAKEVGSAVTQSEALMQKALKSFDKFMSDTAAQRQKDLRLFEQQAAQLLQKFEALQPPTYAVTDASDNSEAAVETVRETHQRNEIHSLLRHTLAQALHFVSEKLKTGHAAETNLLDAAIGDGENVNMLLEKVHELTTQRDGALERLARCEQLIDQHGLTAINRVIMHDAPVESSLDVVEATEQISSLREQLASADAVHKAALNEAAVLRREKENISREAEQTALELKLLKSHNEGLLLSLKECSTREVALLQQVHRQQQQLQRLTTFEGSTSPSCDADLLAGDAKGQLGEKLEELCDGFVSLKQQLTQLTDLMSSNSEDEGTIESRLLRSGVQKVADLLRNALHGADMFRHSLHGEAKAPDAAEESGKTISEQLNVVDGETSCGDAMSTTQPEEAAETHSAMLRESDEELERLRAELAAAASREEALVRSQEELRKQNIAIEEKVSRLLQINKQLVERMKEVQTSAYTKPT